jgi:hypothetical protein
MAKISLSIPDCVYDAVDELAKRERRSRSQMVSILLSDLLLGVHVDDVPDMSRTVPDMSQDGLGHVSGQSRTSPRRVQDGLSGRG